ncbi:MAG: hypothetical protein IRZ28_00700 [Steroidobacteraceae bacterium]|nr:hypothetical protein [Steroidobacteraceae bacterium]
MSPEDLPRGVRELLRDHVTSFERLEVLLLFHRQPLQDWSIDSVSQQARLSPELAAASLEGLAASQLIRQVASSPERVYRFAPASAALAQAVDALSVAYEERRAAVMSFMSTTAIERLRSQTMRAFADSFVFGKKNRNG